FNLLQAALTLATVNVYRLLTFRHLSKADIIGELAAIKSIVRASALKVQCRRKYRVMSTIKIVGDVSVTMSMFESQWKAYGWIQGLLSQQS
ncbi:unnamed protein product, partial [Brassica napus]